MSLLSPVTWTIKVGKEPQSEGQKEGPALSLLRGEAGKGRRLRPRGEERAREIGDCPTFPRAKVLNSERPLS